MEISGNKSVTEREDEGTVVHVRDASGEPAIYENGTGPKPVTITVAGTYSSKYRRAVDAQRDRMLKQRRASLSGEQLNRQQLELVAACVLSWEGFTAEDKPFPLTKDNAVLLLDNAPWIREQVEEAMGDHASFFQKASTN